MIAFITHPDCILHDLGDQHPERPARLREINQHINHSDVAKQLTHYTAETVTNQQLLRAHDQTYLQQIYQQSPQNPGKVKFIDADTGMMINTLNAAEKAAGAGIKAVDLLLTGKHQRAFCAVRPPGHHAERHQAMGFCLFNNIVIAAKHAIHHYGIERLAIIDFDVHHGNGTEQIIGGDPKILLCSSFESPLYPYSGENSLFDNVCNIPLTADTNSQDFRQLISHTWFPRIHQFAPQLIMISAGFDGHHEDEIAHLNLHEQDYHWLTLELKQLANTHAQGRIISMLEGGYALSALARSVEAHLLGLC